MIKEGNLKEAKKILESVKDKNPEATALYAQILDREGDRQTALTLLRKISKSIKDPEILTLLGDLEYSNGDSKKKPFTTGLKHLNLVMQRRPLKQLTTFIFQKK